AVCCSDGEHCCPEGYVCDLSVGECINRSKPSNELKKFLPNINLSSLPTKIGYNNRCPNSDVYCEDNSTCCEHDKEWGCCLFSNAVCCSDGVHCCPANTICDLKAEMCIGESGDILTKLQLKSKPKFNSFKYNSRISICSDMKSVCINGTCCSNVNDQLSTLCCPYENVCFKSLFIVMCYILTFYLNFFPRWTVYNWMYLHLRVDVHSGTRTPYCSLQTPSRYSLSY
ncbi:unnamed protein product, partial [Schistosoma curassoni]|uniref:GRANULINS domain-containing protein n=1 Tax=Schistosoma curassoni TaxID=6186 RepID=A0A183JL27_9TREM